MTTQDADDLGPFQIYKDWTRLKSKSSSDRQRHSRDESGLRRAKVKNRGGDLFRPAKSPDRVALQQPIATLIVAPKPFGHIGFDYSGTNRVHPNSLGGELKGR
jgi:hypothetical protein